MSRFVRDEQTILKLTDGDTLTVRKRLTAGDTRAMYARMYLAGVDGRLRVNPLESGLAKILAYLVDWTLVDDDGDLVAIRGESLDVLHSALDALDPESFTEIREAIDAHEAAMERERDDQKKASSGATASSTTSLSPSAAAGPSTLSAT